MVPLVYHKFHVQACLLLPDMEHELGWSAKVSRHKMSLLRPNNAIAIIDNLAPEFRTELVKKEIDRLLGTT